MSHPFFQPLHPFFGGTDARTEAMQETAIGRNRLDAENRQSNIARLQELLKRPDLQDAQRKRIEMLIARASDTSEGQGTISNLARGVATGIATGPTQVADLALGVPDLITRGINAATGGTSNIARDVRGKLEENMAQVREQINPQGTAGAIGEFAGQLPAGALGYGGAANMIGRGIVKAAPGSALGRIISAAGTETQLPVNAARSAKIAEGLKTLGRQMVTNVATGAPINAIQAATVDDATTEDRLKLFGKGVVFDAAFPVVQKIAALGAQGAKAATNEIGQILDPQTKVTAEPVTGDITTPNSSVAKVDELVQKANETQARKQAERVRREEADAAVAAEWRKANPGKPWSSVPKAERAKMRKEYMDAQAASTAVVKPEEVLQDTPQPKTVPVVVTPPPPKPTAAPVVQAPTTTPADNTAVAPPVPVQNSEQGPLPSVLQPVSQEVKALSAFNALGAASDPRKRAETMTRLYARYKAGELSPSPNSKAADVNLEVAKAIEARVGAQLSQSDFSQVVNQVATVHRQLIRQSIKPMEYQIALQQIIAGTYTPPSPTTSTPAPPTTATPQSPPPASTSPASPPPTPALTGEYRTMPLQVSTNKLLTMQPDEVQTIFKTAKLAYDPDESVLDNLKENVQRKLEANPNDEHALADLELLTQYTKQLKGNKPLPSFEPAPDPSSPAAIIQAGKDAVLPKPAVDPIVPKTATTYTTAQYNKMFNSPNEKLSVDEVHALYNKLDSAIPMLDVMSAKPYVDRKHSLMEYMAQKGIVPQGDQITRLETDTGIGGGFDNSLKLSLGANMYNNTLIQTATKEGLQNAIDSIRANGGQGNINIDYNSGKLSIEDDGIGMLPDVVKKEFVDIGGSFKPGENSSGGFGLAKVGLFSSAKSIKLDTIARDTNGHVINTMLSGSNEDWISFKMKLQVHDLGPDAPQQPKSGTRLFLDYKSEDSRVIDVYRAQEWLNTWSERSMLPIKVTANIEGKKYDSTVIRSKNSDLQVYDKLDTPYATITVYTKGTQSDQDGFQYSVLNNGNYQFETGVWGMKGLLPDGMIFDISSKVPVADGNYPFTLNRESVRGEVRSTIVDYLENVRTQAANRVVDRFKESLRKGQQNKISVPSGAVGVYNSDGVPELDSIAKDVANSVWAIQMSQTLDRVWNKMRIAVADKAPADTQPSDPGVFGGFGLGRRYLGVNIHKQLVNEALGNELLKTNISLYNPFASAEHFDYSATMLAEQAWSTLLHEMAHQIERSHNERYAGALTRLIGPAAHGFTEDFIELRKDWQYALGSVEFNAQHEQIKQAYRSNPNGDESWKNFTTEFSINSSQSPSNSNVNNGPTAPVGNSVSVPQNAGGSGGNRVPPGTNANQAAGSSGSGPSGAGKAGRKDQSYIRPGLIGGVSGMVMGYLTTDADDPDRWTKIALWAAVGAGGTLITKNLWNRVKPVPELDATQIPNIEDIPKVIYSVDELPGRKRPTAEWLRMFYSGTVRGMFGIERAVAKTVVAGKSMAELPAQVNAGKLANMFGRYISMTEAWLTHSPVFVGPNGEPIYLKDEAGNALKPLNQILSETARDNKPDLARVMVARTSLELAAKDGRKTPYTVQEAARILANAPQYLHDAADEMRQYHLGLLKVLLAHEHISQEGYDAMKAENWYAPLARIVNGGDDIQIQNGSQTTIGANTGISARKGASKLPVYNPVEVTMEMTARILKAVEYSNIVRNLWQTSRMAPENTGDLWMRRGENRTNPGVEKMRTKINKLVDELKISENDAAGLLAYMDDTVTTVDTPDGKRYLVTGFEQGKVRTYQVNPEVFDAFKSLHPYEQHWLLKMVSIPTRIAAQGTVHNPIFTGIQMFVDTFHAALTSQYGFRPGIDSLRGWYHVMTNTPQVKALRDLGGPSTIQALKYTGDLKQAVSATHQAGQTPFQTAINQIKEMDLWSAYKTIMLPFNEAARVGEYLRALDHGQSTLEGVYAAWNVMGNVRLQGSAPFIRGMNLLALFARPAISAIDQTVYMAGLPHPRRDGSFDYSKLISFLVKGLSYIAIPSALLWYANKDDQELNNYRKTESGQRYWFIRLPNREIVRIRKPQVIGQIFGTMIENTLDDMYAKDAQGVDNWLSGMSDDVAFNMIPQFGVVPITLLSGKTLGLGTDLVPTRDQKLEPQFWGQDKASLPARLISDKIGAPILRKIDTAFGSVPASLERMISPAGLDLLVRTVGGMWGEDGMKAVTYAVDWAKDDLPPPMSEFPLISRIVVNQHSGNLGTIRMFYQMAERIDRAAATTSFYAQTDPTKLTSYLGEKMPYLILADAYKQPRKNIANYWRAMNDIQHMPDDVVSASQKRMLADQYIKMIDLEARAANTVAKSLLAR